MAEPIEPRGCPTPGACSCPGEDYYAMRHLIQRIVDSDPGASCIDHPGHHTCPACIAQSARALLSRLHGGVAQGAPNTSEITTLEG